MKRYKLFVILSTFFLFIMIGIVYSNMQSQLADQILQAQGMSMEARIVKPKKTMTIASFLKWIKKEFPKESIQMQSKSKEDKNQVLIWSLPNMETAQLFKNELGIETALEVMAGNAYWSKALSEAGIQVWATDSLEWSRSSKTGKKPFYPVENLPADQAVMKYATCDMILCSWAPNFGQADLELIAAKQHYAPAARLFFIGEKGVTNSPEFWTRKHFAKSSELRKINRSFKSYDFIKEKFIEVS